MPNMQIYRRGHVKNSVWLYFLSNHINLSCTILPSQTWHADHPQLGKKVGSTSSACRRKSSLARRFVRSAKPVAVGGKNPPLRGDPSLAHRLGSTQTTPRFKPVA